MKNLIIIICFLFFNHIFPQIGFNVEYEADYKLEYKIYKKRMGVQETGFALLINAKESYFKNMAKYVSDSLKYEKKIIPSGDNLKDALNTMQYYTEFTENIGMTESKIYITAPIDDKNFKYEENNDIFWKILPEFKKIGNYNCQKAITVRYGRTWIAYFAKEIPFPFGPYKFGKLPGLILEVFDSENDYHYTLYKFGKRKYFCKSANLESRAQSVKKEKIFDYKRKQLLNMLGDFRYIEEQEIRTKAIKNMTENMKSYNPIELKIY